MAVDPGCSVRSWPGCGIRPRIASRWPSKHLEQVTTLVQLLTTKATGTRQVTGWTLPATRMMKAPVHTSTTAARTLRSRGAGRMAPAMLPLLRLQRWPLPSLQPPAVLRAGNGSRTVVAVMTMGMIPACSKTNRGTAVPLLARRQPLLQAPTPMPPTTRHRPTHTARPKMGAIFS